GMTEVCGIISYIAGDIFLERPSSAGPLVPVLEGRCVGEAGELKAPGEVGEICVRGTPVIKGYLNRPEATAETIVDGWLHTGDIGYFDEDGFIYLVDRAKDMILRGGENVYGAEVENAIFDHPAVLECVAFAVPDDRLGEEVGAAVHLRDDGLGKKHPGPADPPQPARPWPHHLADDPARPSRRSSLEPSRRVGRRRNRRAVV
ncbi:MAG: hypothetical protein EBY49_01230, partial [Actinobacteria bacterium]|nr:hypothetical protein [Actinomycetota bacterium]